jgi:hypothetical protein
VVAAAKQIRLPPLYAAALSNLSACEYTVMSLYIIRRGEEGAQARLRIT